MSTTVCLLANTLYYPKGGGLLWIYLNWALGLRAVGCRVIWLERIVSRNPALEEQARVAALKSHLKHYGLAEDLVLCSYSGKPLPWAAVDGCLDFEAAAEADLLMNVGYQISPELLGRFRRSALLDIDPGLLQVWMSKGQISIPPHDVYFTIGETVGRPQAKFPDIGLKWQYTPPCVALDWWLPHQAPVDAPFTTVTHWSGGWTEDGGEAYRDDKRAGFLPFLDLPRSTAHPLELALVLAPWEDDERVALQQRGWRVRDAHAVASTPWDYQQYIYDSFGEFSCAKPTYVRLETAWISDRTICYLASGKPAVVQHTGDSRILPDSAGLFRFHTVEEAAHCVEKVEADYERQCRLARALAAEHFDAQKVVGHLLERALA